MNNSFQLLLQLLKDIYTVLLAIQALGEQKTVHTPTPLLSKPEVSQPPVLIDINQVISILNISIATYYRWVRQGELVPRRKGKRHYYYLEDLTKQLEEGKRRGRI